MLNLEFEAVWIIFITRNLTNWTKLTL
jgi:hypothetical protein